MIKRLKSRRFQVKLALFLLVIGLLAWVIHSINSPAKGSIAVPRETNPVARNDTSFTTLSNDYYTLLYPSEMNPSLPEQKQASVAGYSYLATKNSKTSLEVYVKDLPSGGITLDSDYKTYASNSSYKLSQMYSRGELVDVATGDKGVHERAALWVHGRYLMIIKLKSDTKTDLDTNFKTIVKSVQWQKT